ncbi:hypothetical conserved protein (plasmid) [Rhizobium etli CFN 42]|uniref:Hypothetical conserved protein n=2 Tax=Rhizobium etli TaxID=29449 RepID=Q2K0R2_RHIEC|nr:hypothetical conserved protein [Rhizobium etli CFN 42]AGS24901.1 hypothetical protein REMIM1_PD00290 [Rhizobium etli bv. mimosae str. Mim1]
MPRRRCFQLLLVNATRPRLHPEEILMKKLVRLLLTIVLAFVVVIGFRWYRYIANTDSPYDEVGITLNSSMPGPLNAWGCAKLKQTFGSALPPYGCAADNGTRWK